VFKNDITDAEMKYADDYFLSLFNNNHGTKQIVVNIFKTIFCGKKLRNIFHFTGDGRNGKSLLFNLLKSIFTDAVEIISGDVLLENSRKGQINTELEKLETILFGYITELKETDESNTTMIKKISGNDPIDCRPLYKTNRTIIPTANLGILTNKLAKFNVEQAILDRNVVCPMNARFDLNSTFESEMLSKNDILFTYIMKIGVITPDIDHDSLTDEMKVAMNDYKEDNVKDYLEQFFTKKFRECSYDNTAPIATKNRTRQKCDEFMVEYKEFLKHNGYGREYDNLNKFIRKVKKSLKLESLSSNSKRYFIGIERRPYDSDYEDEYEEESD
jgi:phage/plasmid-associated DNA primase